MVLGTPELVVILVLVLVLFGPQKLPELARAIGQAVGEYNKAKREFEGEINKVKSEIEKEAREINADVMVEESRRNSAEIRKIARGMGIPTEGKDDATLLKEIESRVTKRPTAGYAGPKAPPGFRKPFTKPAKASPSAKRKLVASKPTRPTKPTKTKSTKPRSKATGIKPAKTSKRSS
jgi:TatA/E family protein of Tat protein translocase